MALVPVGVPPVEGGRGEGGLSELGFRALLQRTFHACANKRLTPSTAPGLIPHTNDSAPLPPMGPASPPPPPRPTPPSPGAVAAPPLRSVVGQQARAPPCPPGPAPRWRWRSDLSSALPQRPQRKTASLMLLALLRRQGTGQQRRQWRSPPQQRLVRQSRGTAGCLGSWRGRRSWPRPARS